MSKEKNFDQVKRVLIPEFSDKELEDVLSKQNEEDVMKALGYEKKQK